MSKQIGLNKHKNKVQSLVLSACVFVAAFLLLKTLSLLDVGVDLTDEGYYFNWISNPWLYKYYASQFGYVYHPIYKALGGSIIELRQANLLISFGLAWLLSFLLLKQLINNVPRTYLLMLSAALAIPALFILMITGHWVPSPSYNSLNLQGVLIAGIGFVLANYQQPKSGLLTSVCIGIGGWLVFMAKPSTALFLTLATALFFAPTIKRDWRVLLVAGLTAIMLFLCSAWVIDSSVSQFIKRYQGGISLMQAMASGHGLSNLFRLDLFSVSTGFLMQLITLTLMLTAALWIVNSQRPRLVQIVYALCLFGMVYTAFYLAFPPKHQYLVEKYHLLIMLSVLFASVMFRLIWSAELSQSPHAKLFYLFLVMPYFYAAGSGNNYWFTASGAMCFWVLASLLLLARARANMHSFNVLAVFVVCLTVFAMVASLRYPYRQSQVIYMQTHTFVDPHTKQTLTLTKDGANYLNTINQVAKSAGFQPQTPMIDLTGHHPGALYFLNAKAIGQAWTIGGYKGSAPLASMGLYQASCLDVASAWLLIEKDGRRQIPSTILSEHGIQADKAHYQVMGKFNSQKLHGFNAVNRKVTDGIYQQYLLKPIDVEAQTQACLTYRKTHDNPFLTK